MGLFFFLEEIKKEPLKNGPYLEIALDILRGDMCLSNNLPHNLIVVFANGAPSDASNTRITASINHSAINELPTHIDKSIYVVSYAVF